MLINTLDAISKINKRYLQPDWNISDTTFVLTENKNN